jgi:hypothetical protein
MADTPKAKRWTKLKLTRKKELEVRNRMGRILWGCRGGRGEGRRIERRK